MDWLQHVLAWLDNPAVKYALVLIGGFLLKRWPAFVNGAIPAVTAIASLLIALLHVIFPDAQAAAPALESALGGAMAQADSVARAMTTAGGAIPWWQALFFNGILPWLIAVGTHSGVKNSGQWLTNGGGFVRASQ